MKIAVFNVLLDKSVIYRVHSDIFWESVGCALYVVFKITCVGASYFRFPWCKEVAEIDILKPGDGIR